nr:hypothetical protein [uncultured Sulfurimonas sp.]
MLIKYSDGESGIIDYMKYGRKKDRDFARDEADTRVSILGDIDTTEHILNGTDKGYKHITLSFKEDHVSEDECKQLIDEYMSFLMHGYDKNEYNAYAEIHYPKLKSYTSNSGELVVRKPHIHLVIPKTNLLTGKQLRPLGFVKQNIEFTDAFQEKFNIENGFASPENNRSSKLNNEFKERYDYEIFEKDVELKNELIDSILKGDVRSYEEFKNELSRFGDIRESNATQARGGYLSVKEPHHSKYVRLKEFMFTKEFIEKYSKEQKIDFMLKKEDERFIDKSDKEQTKDLNKYNKDLKYWFDVRALEVKYINQSSKFYKETYQNYDKEQKIDYLQKVHAVFYKDNSINFEKYEPQNAIEIKVDNEVATNSVVSQKLDDIKNEKYFEKKHINVDMSRIFKILKSTQGVLDTKYQLVDGKVVAGNSHLDLKSFLKDHMHYRVEDIQALENKINQLKKKLEQGLLKMKNVNINIKVNESDKNRVDYYQLGAQDVAGRFSGIIHDKASEHDTARAYVLNDKVVSKELFKTQEKELYEAMLAKHKELFNTKTTTKHNDKLRIDVVNTDVSLTNTGQSYANSKYNMKQIKPIEMGITKFDKKLDKNFFTIAKEFITVKNFRDNFKVKYHDFKQNIKAIVTGKPELAASNIVLAAQLKQLKQELDSVKTYNAAQELLAKQQKNNKEQESTQTKEVEKPEKTLKEIATSVQQAYDSFENSADGIELVNNISQINENTNPSQIEDTKALIDMYENVQSETIDKDIADELVNNIQDIKEVEAANFMSSNRLQILSVKDVKNMVETISETFKMSQAQDLDFDKLIGSVMKQMSNQNTKHQGQER